MPRRSRIPRPLAWLLCGLAPLGSARAVCAAEPGPVRFSVIASGLYGHELTHGYPEDAHGAGLDLRFGVTLPVPIYVGASFSYFFGVSSNEALFSNPPIFVSHSSSISQALGHLGYEWDLKLVQLRPNMGVGFSHTSIDVMSAGATMQPTHAKSFSNDLVLSPGLELLVPVGLISLCAQMRYDATPNASEDRKVLVFGGGLGGVF